MFERHFQEPELTALSSRVLIRGLSMFCDSHAEVLTHNKKKRSQNLCCIFITTDANLQERSQLLEPSYFWSLQYPVAVNSIIFLSPF